MASIPKRADGWTSLSRREREIAARFAEGLTYQQIGEALCIAPATVRAHLATIYRKLNVHNKAALVRLVLTQGAAANLADEGLHDVTPEDAMPAAQPAAAAGAPRRWGLPAAVGLFVAVLLGGIWHFWPTEPVLATPSIAVLPFENLGGDGTTGRLADGITEDVITDLARFRDLDVIARNSTEVYHGRPVDVRQVGKELGVGYVLEGSIQRQGERMRVTAQLIDAGDGAQVWVDRWERAAADLFQIQDEIAEKVAGTLGGALRFGQIARHEAERAKGRRPADLTAYDLYLLGVEAKAEFSRDAILRGIEFEPEPSRASPTSPAPTSSAPG
jgi:TolB-like protein/DNA-binding CsgD family transcriptional regulator